MTGFSVLQALVGTGGGWVIYLLLVASLLTIAVIVERVIVQRRERRAFLVFKEKTAGFLNRGEILPAAASVEKAEGVAAVILRAGLARPEAGHAAVEERLAAARIEGKYQLERQALGVGDLGEQRPVRRTFWHRVGRDQGVWRFGGVGHGGAGSGDGGVVGSVDCDCRGAFGGHPGGHGL
jgi:hypothetical protein